MMHRWFKTDFPLRRDDTNRMLPWIVAFMVYLACLTMIASINMNHYIADKSATLNNAITIQIPGTLRDEEREAVVTFLKQLDDLEEVAVLPERDVKALLEPWLGTGDAVDALPLPAIVEARFKAGSFSDAAELRQKVQELNPAVEVDDHHSWLEKLNAFTHSVQLVAAIIVLMIIGITVAVVVLAARTGLKLHSGAINILHMIGATDHYIARQFQYNALLLAAKGGLLGIALTVPTLLPLHHLSAELGWLQFPVFQLSFGHLGVMLGVLLFTAGIAFACARLTVLRMLTTQP